MNTFHRLYLQDLLEVTGVNMKGEFVYSYFRLAVREFLRMVDIDEKAGFSCPECGPIPKRCVINAIKHIGRELVGLIAIDLSDVSYINRSNACRVSLPCEY